MYTYILNITYSVCTISLLCKSSGLTFFLLVSSSLEKNFLSPPLSIPQLPVFFCGGLRLHGLSPICFGIPIGVILA